MPLLGSSICGPAVAVTAATPTASAAALNADTVGVTALNAGTVDVTALTAGTAEGTALTAGTLDGTAPLAAETATRLGRARVEDLRFFGDFGVVTIKPPWFRPTRWR
jgi:hypothetical protein